MDLQLATCLPAMRTARKSSLMTVRLTVLHLALVMALWPALGAARSPSALTPAEANICLSLSHCLKILDTHPHDSFDYAVLSDAFTQYGKRGRRALLRRLKKADIAGNAADLLALSQDPSILPELEKLRVETAGETAALVGRTIDAIRQRRRQPQPDAPIKRTSAPPLISPPPCPLGRAADPASQRKEMPYFEAAIARPDRFGAFRPSAVYRVSTPHAERPDLRSAVSRLDGWVAGYDGGLLRYDSRTGEPEVLTDMGVITLQRKYAQKVDSGVWAVLKSKSGLIIIDALSLSVYASMPGHLIGLRRTEEDHLLISSSNGLTLSIDPDGKISSGCPAENP
jgi:hypothetical protein